MTQTQTGKKRLLKKQLAERHLLLGKTLRVGEAFDNYINTTCLRHIRYQYQSLENYPTPENHSPITIQTNPATQ